MVDWKSCVLYMIGLDMINWLIGSGFSDCLSSPSKWSVAVNGLLNGLLNYSVIKCSATRIPSSHDTIHHPRQIGAPSLGDIYPLQSCNQQILAPLTWWTGYGQRWKGSQLVMDKEQRIEGTATGDGQGGKELRTEGTTCKDGQGAEDRSNWTGQSRNRRNWVRYNNIVRMLLTIPP